MLMPDPASAMHDLERLLDLPCPEWTADMACRGVDLDCQGVADGQQALRQAIAGGGTYHDVLGRLGHAIEAAALPAKRRLIALAVVDVARSQSRQRLGLALRQLAGAGDAASARGSCKARAPSPPTVADEVTEGATRLFPPATNLAKTRSLRAPGAKEKGQPFYNPGMALNRDLSVLLVEAHARQAGREIDVADVLAGTGARSLRLAHEVDPAVPVIVHANDGDPAAVAALRKGAAANRIPDTRLQVREGDAHVLLAGRRFDIIDLDPFGSPMPFADAAMRAVRHGGLVCATATDTGALAGAFPKACRRRYDAHHGLNRAPWKSEVGLRILGGALVRAAARFDRAAVPVLSIQHGHWMRVVARVGDSKRGGDASFAQLGDAWLDADGLGQVGRRAPDSVGPAFAGPLWTGPLHDAALLDGMTQALAGKALARPDEIRGLLGLLRGEAEAPPFWVVPDRFQKALGAPPRRDALLERLRAAGHVATRTHLDPQGVRTTASLAQLRASWRA